MGTRLTHVPFDIETSGFETDAAVSVVGFSLPLGCRVFLNADGHPADADRLESRLSETFETAVQVRVHPDERALLEAVAAFLGEAVAPREYLLVAYNGERFNGGFDLPFLRTRYALLGLQWPFDDVPYADVLPLIRKRFNTTADGEDRNDLVTAYDTLVGNGLTAADPFDDSGEAVAAFEAGEFEPLLAHNVADVLRTGALASLAERFCGKSEFDLKSLTPSARDPALTDPPRG
ncbi:hypothetical protein [Halorientalis halophila]|uniref:hypothetical protein n=1 Tax=Halorientalis halophila TaxID=3108499 RepID=UPI0030080C26